MGGTPRDTTDASGAYSFTRVNSNSSTNVNVTATLTSGTMTRTGTGAGTIASPADGTTDLVTVNIIINNGTVQPAAGDTAVVSGIVTDSTGAAVAGAVITYRFGTGGGGGGAAVDTTDATGAYSFTAVNTNRQNSLRVTATVGTGATSVNGRTTISIAAPADGVKDVLTVNIIIGQQQNSIRLTSGIAKAPRVQTITGVYLLNGRQLNKAVLTNSQIRGPKAMIVRYQNGARMKVSVDK